MVYDDKEEEPIMAEVEEPKKFDSLDYAVKHEEALRELSELCYEGSGITVGETVVELMQQVQKHNAALAMVGSLLQFFPRTWPVGVPHNLPDMHGLQRLLRQLGVAAVVQVACENDHGPSPSPERGKRTLNFPFACCIPNLRCTE